jgi:site-specific recombinase XerD
LSCPRAAEHSAHWPDNLEFVADRLDDLAASFRRDLRAEGRAERTATIYLQSIRFFGQWLEAQGRPATLDQLTRSAIRTWLAGLADVQQAGTVRTRYKGLRRFSRWLHAEGEIDADPMAGMEVPAVVDKPVPVLDDAELAALLKACQGKTFADRRDEAVVRFLLDTGCRVSEMCGITLDDVDLDHELVIVTGKGRKTRPVYFGARTARAIDRYVRERRSHRYAHSPALFLSQRGQLSMDGVRDLLTRRAQLAGLKQLNPHRFRHTFAHDFLLAGGQERDLKRLAGWSSDVMLERYGSSAADVRAREAVKRMRRGDRV